MHIRAGFRAVVHRPALALGEIAWRWAFGAAAWTLIIVAVRRILAGIDITEAERLIARRSDVFLIADACSRILAQVLPQLARECLVLAPALAVMWIAAATVGRAVTLQTLASMPVILSEASPGFGGAESKDPCASPARSQVRPHFGRLASLNVLRALFTLATLIALFGTMFLIGGALSAQGPTTAIVVGILVAALLGFFWSIVNWFLAVAPIWIVRDGRPALKSVADSLELYRRFPGPYVGIASAFGLFRAVALVAALIAALIAAQGSAASAVALSVVIALVYFAAADFLYIARLAAFVALDGSTQPSAISIQPLAAEPVILPSTPPANSNG